MSFLLRDFETHLFRPGNMRPLLRQPSPASLLATTCRACQRRCFGLSARRPIPTLPSTVPSTWTRNRNSATVYNVTPRRGITQNYLRRTAEAKEQWKGWAEEIKRGERQSFAALLKERGFIHDVVGGCVAIPLCWPSTLGYFFLSVELTC